MFTTTTKKAIALFMATIISLWLIIIYVSSKMNMYEAKLSMAIEQREEAKTKAATKSDIELLEFYAQENANFAKERLKDIEYHRQEILTLQDLYEFEILGKRCFEAQISRKINWLEYNLEYCKDESNLDQYRTEGK